eukprot:5942449-Pleurochrysis_carterae.AAC.2
MRDYPDVDEYPGVEDWLPEEKHRVQWEALKAWHVAYSISASITVGMTHIVIPSTGGNVELKIGGCTVERNVEKTRCTSCWL